MNIMKKMMGEIDHARVESISALDSMFHISGVLLQSGMRTMMERFLRGSFSQFSDAWTKVTKAEQNR